MKSIVILSFLACVLVSTFTSVYGDTKNCFCRVVSKGNGFKEIKYLGSVDAHHHWLRVGCGQLDNCYKHCDAAVATWACSSECTSTAGTQRFIPYYEASNCGGKGHLPNNVRTCGSGCVKVYPKPPPSSSGLSGLTFSEEPAV
ncbi:uncharacterized protein LOC128216754 [Mya arenaria]|uniref:uncharacterized protein LOC128216690 n=1 Tax=Mya arenaria TaxID=6604 RepID=UPI0022E668D9|nr:uncharacterized protein LOC128216690 [Mya arenaria]XP_052779369.1 uncharacterized protein LOC128216754 [Mya arenaria]